MSCFDMEDNRALSFGTKAPIIWLWGMYARSVYMYVELAVPVCTQCTHGCTDSYHWITVLLEM